MDITNVSREMKEILIKCENNEFVSLADVEAIPEIRDAQMRLDADADKLIEQVEKITGIRYSRNEINTTKLPAEMLVQRQDNALEKLDQMRSAVVENGITKSYNGDIKREGHLDIVIGLPASGKSSAIVDSLSQFYNARIVDNDEAKKLLENEFDNGFGATLVHYESQDISATQLKESLAKRENLVIPKVGSGYDSIKKIVVMARKAEYDKINIHYVDLPRNKAMGRLLGRFITQGRYLQPSLIEDYCNSKDGNKIQKTYDLFKQGGEVDGYAKWNNDVRKGESPILEESKGIKEINRIQQERAGLVRSGLHRGDGSRSFRSVRGENGERRQDHIKTGAHQTISTDINGAGRREGAKLPESGIKDKTSLLGALKAKQKIVCQNKADKFNREVTMSNKAKTNDISKE